MSGRVHIVQCLCPQRHCIIAMAWEESEFETLVHAIDRCRAMLADLEAKGLLNHRCGLCGSTDFHYEDGVTPFASLEEAMPSISEQAAAQLATRRHFDRERN